MKRRPWIVEGRAKVEDAHPTWLPWIFCACYGTEMSAKEGLDGWKAVYGMSMPFPYECEFRIRNRNAETS